MLSITSLTDDIKRTLEPRTASPLARLRVIRELSRAGVPVGVLVAPVIPAITDHEMEDILAAARAAGASSAGYVLLRLPHELKVMFREWLEDHYPDRAAHVMSLINQARGGKDYDSQFGVRMKGTGAYAELLRARFDLAERKLGLRATRMSATSSTPRSFAAGPRGRTHRSFRSGLVARLSAERRIRCRCWMRSVAQLDEVDELGRHGDAGDLGEDVRRASERRRAASRSMSEIRW